MFIVNRYRCGFVFGVFLLCLPSIQTAFAQNFGLVEETRSNIQSYYFHVLPGEATVQVQVLGTVRSPGLYVIGVGTDLGQLLALSGGPVISPREGSVSREIFVRLFRPRGGSRNLLYEGEFDRVVNTMDPLPVLEDGDVMTIEVIEKKGFVWRDILAVIGAVAAVALAVERFSN
jgi:hypothetical protein